MTLRKFLFIVRGRDGKKGESEILFSLSLINLFNRSGLINDERFFSLRDLHLLKIVVGIALREKFNDPDYRRETPSWRQNRVLISIRSDSQTVLVLD